MLKRLNILLLVISLVFIFSVTTMAEEKQVVEFWHGFQSGRVHETMNEMIEEFEETHPNIEVNQTLVAWGQINDKVLSAIAAGNPPDVFRAWADNVSWAARGALEPLDTFIEDDPEWNPEDYWPQVIEQSTYDGKIYAVSPSIITNAFFYNKDRYKEVGLDPEQPPDTIEELDEYNDKLTELSSKEEIDTLGILPSMASVDNWIYAFGGQLYDEEGEEITANHPKNIEAFEWIASYAEKYGIDNLQSWIASNESGQFGRWNANGPYYTGELASWVIGQWHYNDIKEYAPDMDFGMSYVPSPEGWPNTSSRLNSNFFLMPKGAENQEAAWELLKFLSDEYYMRHMVATDAVTPAKKDLAFDEEFEKNNPWIVPIREKLMPKATATPNTLPVINEYMEQLDSALEKVMFGELSAKAALDQVQTSITRELERARR